MADNTQNIDYAKARDATVAAVTKIQTDDKDYLAGHSGPKAGVARLQVLLGMIKGSDNNADHKMAIRVDERFGQTLDLFKADVASDAGAKKLFDDLTQARTDHDKAFGLPVASAAADNTKNPDLTARDATAAAVKKIQADDKDFLAGHGGVKAGVDRLLVLLGGIRGSDKTADHKMAVRVDERFGQTLDLLKNDVASDAGAKKLFDDLTQARADHNKAFGPSGVGAQTQPEAPAKPAQPATQAKTSQPAAATATPTQRTSSGGIQLSTDQENAVNLEVATAAGALKKISDNLADQSQYAHVNEMLKTAQDESANIVRNDHSLSAGSANRTLDALKGASAAMQVLIDHEKSLPKEPTPKQFKPKQAAPGKPPRRGAPAANTPDTAQIIAAMTEAQTGIEAQANALDKGATGRILTQNGMRSEARDNYSSMHGTLTQLKDDALIMSSPRLGKDIANADVTLPSNYNQETQFTPDKAATIQNSLGDIAAFLSGFKGGKADTPAAQKDAADATATLSEIGDLKTRVGTLVKDTNKAPGR